MTSLDCPSKRCTGTLTDPPDAAAVLEDGRAVEWRTCGRCRRVVERDVPLDHPELDLGGAL